MEELTGDKFKAYFNDMIQAALNGKGDPEAIFETMRRHGFETYFPETVLKEIAARSKDTGKDGSKIPHNCKWCGVCGLCGACGGLDFGAGGAASAGLLGILD